MMPQPHDNQSGVRFNLRWAGIVVSVFYGVITIPLLFFPSVFKLAAFLLTWSDNVPGFTQLLSELGHYFGVFSYSLGMCTLLASLAGFACSTGIDTMRKRVFGRFFLWLPVLLSLFFFFFLKYF